MDFNQNTKSYAEIPSLKSVFGLNNFNPVGDKILMKVFNSQTL